MPARLLIAAYATLVGMPVALGWLLVGPARAWPDELSSALALAGFAALLLEFLLSGRFRAVTGGIGIAQSMRWHQRLARALTLALLVHPFLYTTPTGPQVLRPDDLARAGVLHLDAHALVTGAIGWLLLGVLTLTAIGRDSLPWRYESWRLMHGLGAALLAVLGLGHALRAGRYSAHPVVVAYWCVLLALAVLSLVAVYGLRPIRLARRPWRIVAVTPAAERCWQVVLEPVGHAGLRFRAGQFAWVRLDRPAWSMREHPFSIASAPGGDGRLAFLIKEAGDFTRTVGSLRPGARAFVEGPHGTLSVEGRGEPGLCLIGGGAGVAPLLSILRARRRTPAPRPAMLVYGNRHEGQILAEDELPTLGVEVIHVLQEPPPGWAGETGMITRDLVARRCARAAAAGWLFLLCGPPPMMREARAGLAAMGVPARRILEEGFAYD
ncbi:ferric reductase-like transmembrane domain-containing protein [Roseomonas sp. CECT 9278]|uniref:ferredoxin reductase family protein n=1 Tax=Roseomonas sp. CECT 9278 TaxID=2845823 RepID=UPI001E5EFB89|nr:ferric reductase-like transmembrane domain-containing protein [Roseomonas sp. CECT 9278]CAH0156913.1 Dihydroorotate dehydrogenase B (NAD(+)), electron transfer subunit [Roseomonas sp. CECT 9278]